MISHNLRLFKFRILEKLYLRNIIKLEILYLFIFKKKYTLSHHSYSPYFF